MKFSDFPNCISKYDVYIFPSEISVFRDHIKVLSFDSLSPFYEKFKHGYDELTEAGGDRDAFIEMYIKFQVMFK